MSLTIYNICKWTKMLLGKSIYHVNQDVGKFYKINSVCGYYNDLTEKVINEKNFDKMGIPKTIQPEGEIYFPIAIFQFGLGAYDIYIGKGDNVYKDYLKKCADWAVNEQLESGAWDTFGFKNKGNPYSSMAQGEGVSLLLRAYNEFNNKEYLDAAKKAMNFMLTSFEDGGTCKYENNEIKLYEYTNTPLVLNGWIFSFFGLHDYMLVVNDEEINEIYKKALQTIIKYLPKYDLGYWSKYDLGYRITSPFYHKLHIAQLKVMYDLTGESIFLKYANKWEKNLNSPVKFGLAFIKKAFQKITEKE